MSVVRSPRVRRAVPLLAALAIAGACSSSSVTGPNTSKNAMLLAHFDSLRVATASGFRVDVYAEIEEMLAEGAPVGSAMVTVNGSSSRVNIVAQLEVQDLNGAPFDSVYTIGAWLGDGSDSAMVFGQSGISLLAVTAFGSASAEDFDVTGTVVVGAPRGACTSFLSLAPPDIAAPAPLGCQLQTASDAFTIVLDGGQGDTISLPNQKVTGIRIVTAVSAPPP
ncbi:MAG TPA: hypothetical protein VF102_03960 [Gemmatimonadaceae bacterium]|jgi:hypothetical protein